MNQLDNNDPLMAGPALMSPLSGKNVTVFVNGKPPGSKGAKLRVTESLTVAQLLQSAGSRFGISAKHLFDAGGREIDDLLMLDDGDVAFVSGGASFVGHKASPAGGRGVDGATGGASGGDADDKGRGNGSGTVVGGYVLTEYLGRGCFGRVYKGMHTATREPAALKFISKERMANVRDAERVSNEIQCLERLSHPSIIKLSSVESTEKDMVLVFEFAGNGDLHSKVKEKGRLSEGEAWRYFKDIVDGVTFCHHRSIVHQDLKLENILLDDDDNVKIADFGLARTYRPGTMHRSTAGSLAYLAPEVLMDGPCAGPPRDVWSLGVLLFAMTCGRLPFEGGGNEKLLEKRIKSGVVRFPETSAPGDLCRDLILKMLYIDPEARATLAVVSQHPWMLRHARLKREQDAADKLTELSAKAAPASASESDSHGDGADADDDEPRDRDSTVESVGANGGAGGPDSDAERRRSSTSASESVRRVSQASAPTSSSGGDGGADDALHVDTKVKAVQPSTSPGAPTVTEAHGVDDDTEAPPGRALPVPQRRKGSGHVSPVSLSSGSPLHRYRKASDASSNGQSASHHSAVDEPEQLRGELLRTDSSNSLMRRSGSARRLTSRRGLRGLSRNGSTSSFDVAGRSDAGSVSDIGGVSDIGLALSSDEDERTPDSRGRGSRVGSGGRTRSTRALAPLRVQTSDPSEHEVPLSPGHRRLMSRQSRRSPRLSPVAAHGSGPKFGDASSPRGSPGIAPMMRGSGGLSSALSSDRSSSRSRRRAALRYSFHDLFGTLSARAGLRSPSARWRRATLCIVMTLRLREATALSRAQRKGRDAMERGVGVRPASVAAARRGASPGKSTRAAARWRRAGTAVKSVVRFSRGHVYDSPRRAGTRSPSPLRTVVSGRRRPTPTTVARERATRGASSPGVLTPRSQRLTTPAGLATTHTQVHETAAREAGVVTPQRTFGALEEGQGAHFRQLRTSDPTSV